MFSSRIHCVYFSLHTAEEIKTLAVKKVTNPQTYDALLHPMKNGFMDPAFGPNDQNGLCDTCGLGSMHCPGHFGYIELPLPVYHPMFFQLMLKILKGSCMICHRLIATMSKSHLFVRQCELLEKGLLTEAIYLKDIYASANAEAVSASATEMNLQKQICDELDSYYNTVTKDNRDKSNSAKRTSTKNLVRMKLELIKDFIQAQLGAKGDCPHCGAPQKLVRHEYNTRVYFKVAQSKVRKISQLKKEKEKSSRANSPLSPVQERTVAIRAPRDEILDEGENEEEDEDERRENEGGQEDRETKPCGKPLSQEYITPDEVKQHMIQLWNTDGKVLECLLGSYNLPSDKKKVTTPEIFFLDVVAVPPTRFRPQSTAGDKVFENPQTANLTKILWHVKLVEEILKRIRNGDEDDGTTVSVTSEHFQRAGGAVTVPGATFKEQLNNAWSAMQSDVNTFMDSSLNKLTRTPLPGVRQLLEKKEGLFRKHMMGKRVNYACRSVISPDPYINTDEIGVPMVFASKLTYPQPVTAWNLNQLKQMVINGPNKYPGAVMVEFEDGRKKTLSMLSESKRKAVANQLLTSSVAASGAGNDGNVNKEKKVYRHLLNGDVMLLNRQPTLHKPSIMAHKVKVLPKERTLRLHYANCKSYNADFDGDEMNAHLPQSELGRAEAYNLVSTNFNYLSPKDGKPLAGLIQDHVVSGVRMTSRETLFNREDYQQLIFNALIDKPGRIKLLPPCIVKPVPLWSGKQIFSSVLLNIIPHDKPAMNMIGNKARVSDDNWPKGKAKKKSLHKDDPLLKENQVIIRGGELMTGILDKTQYGATAFSLVHCVYELYGGVISGKLLSALARLFTAYLQHAGFTLGVEDILVLPHAEEKRQEILHEGRQCGDESALEAVNIQSCDKETLYKRLQEAHFNNQGAELKQLDLAMKSRTDAINNKVNNVCMRGLLKKFPSNSLQLMVQSGAKGSSVNTMQISCLLGQIELEGRRPPLSVSGRSLPSFVPYDTSPRAGGFVDGRFLTGIRPQEYFFHCMAGREGLIDTAVKTSRSGYLQRCLIKHLEALYVQYDMTVRDGDGSVVQFLYGDDSVDVLKCQYLQTNQFRTVLDNYQSYVNILKPSEMSKVVDVKRAQKLQKKQDKWRRNHTGELYGSKFHKAAFHLYEKDHRRKVEKKLPSKERKNGRTEADMRLFNKWYEASETRKASYEDQCTPCPDPCLARFNPSCYFGAVSEKFRACVKDYIEKNPDGMLNDDDDDDEDDDEGENEKDQNRRRVCDVNKETFLPMMMIKYMRSLVEPGEAVGLLAAQSVGEPSTQMTLNTFHFAGRGEMNVTLGIPRLREILMTASEAIKTPQMDVLIKPGEEENAKLLAKSFTRITLMEVLKQISVLESLEKSCIDPTSRCREFTIRFETLPPYTYEDTTVIDPEKVMTFIETDFILRIINGVVRMIRAQEKEKLLNSSSVERMNTNRLSIEGNENVAPDEPDDTADLSDDDVGGDGGADDIKGRNRRIQFTSYDDPDTPEVPDDVDGEPEDSHNMSMKEEVQEEIKPKLEAATFPENLRLANVLRRDRRITGYVVDEENQWCEVTMQFPLSGSKVMLVGMIEKLAEKAVIHSAPGINRAMVTESKNPNEMGKCRLKTEGVNIQELWKHPEILNLETLYSNNIHKVAKTYGIEAARRVLIKEVQDVFKVYGIHIDARHLSLIADYMTYEGIYKPFNRIGIQTNPFPFQKMSFETSMNFLRSATAFGQPDELGSPSSRIIVGRVINQGTGMMDLLPKLTA